MIGKEFRMDDDAANQLLEKCRAENPQVTAGELVIMGTWKLRQVGAKVQNPVGLLLASLPKMVKSAMYEQARRKAAAAAATVATFSPDPDVERFLQEEEERRRQTQDE